LQCDAHFLKHSEASDLECFNVRTDRETVQVGGRGDPPNAAKSGDTLRPPIWNVSMSARTEKRSKSEAADPFAWKTNRLGATIDVYSKGSGVSPRANSIFK